MIEPIHDNTFNYWMDWLDAHSIDHTKISDKDLSEWMHGMEKVIGDHFMNSVPSSWLDKNEDDVDDEWENIPHENDDCEN